MDEKLTTRERFIKIYANLPLKIRDEIIFVTQDQKPITWNVAYVEIQGNTQLAQEILHNLEQLNII